MAKLTYLKMLEVLLAWKEAHPDTALEWIDGMKHRYTVENKKALSAAMYHGAPIAMEMKFSGHDVSLLSFLWDYYAIEDWADKEGLLK